MSAILLVDDDEALIRELAERVKNVVEADIRVWIPSKEDGSPKNVFMKHLGEDTALVVTDSDLTGRGLTGLFGSIIVDWCQQLAIPVADFSRAAQNLPQQPDFFELRVPTDPGDAARYIASLYVGFEDIGRTLQDQDLAELRSPQATLAGLLGRSSADSDLSLYGIRLGPTSGALWDRIRAGADEDEKLRILRYITGHLLVNAVLRFPGPILSLRALEAYVAVGPEEGGALQEVFDRARYAGPFKELGPYFWLESVDELLEGFAGAEEARTDPNGDATIGEINRVLLERRLGKAAVRHGCPRCQGKNGGFWCPFTDRTVCTREDCSVGPNSWIPQGARLCRIERDFFDELAPILGL